jgi:hypothetical protein
MSPLICKDIFTERSTNYTQIEMNRGNGNDKKIFGVYSKGILEVLEV